MAIPKKAKIIILIMLVLSLGVYLFVKLELHTGYIRRNPKKTIAHLERIFEIDFPDDIQDVKAAKAFLEWDNWRTYIIKFKVDPNTLDSFINIERLSRYDPNEDERSEDIFPPTKWYSEPIQKGRMGTIDLDSRRGGGYDAYVYIDTSDEKSFVVYTGVSYGGHEDKLAR